MTGTAEPLPLDELDRSVVVLPTRGQELLLNGLVDALKLDPSVDVRQRAPGGVQADVGIRGSGFGQTLVLLNGQPLNDVQSGHHDMDIPIPLDSVARIEVLHGAGSTLYGSDAVAGAINIITTPPEGTDIRLRAAIGNFDTNQERVSLAGRAGELAEQFVASRDFSSGFAPDRDYRNLQLASTTHFRRSDLTLAYMDHPFGADQFYGNFNSWEDTKTWLAAYQQGFGDNTTFSASYRRHSDLFVLYRDRPAVFTNHHADDAEHLALRRRDPITTSVTVSYGGEAIHESIASNNLGSHSRSRAAAYAAVDFHALRRYSLSLSAREEVYRWFSAEFSPTVAAGAWLSAQWKLRASASRAFRVPSYTDLYYHDPGNVGTPNLRPERASSYETGADWNPGRRVRAEATVFTRRVRDGIDYFRASPGDIWRALNIASINFTGIEASLQIATVQFRWTGLRARQDTVPLGFTKYSFDYPKHSAVAEWQDRLRGALIARTRIGVLARFGQNPYALWEASAAYARGPVRPFVQLANITSTSYQEIQGVSMPGRSVLGGIELVLKK